ncbi:MAG: excalibur calcium-binding domain-containing protein [Gammaproteobacteria bacterium]|nr:excalibur calcium-binding domain-containing protein [Gammaproteobacteria bacterium]
MRRISLILMLASLIAVPGISQAKSCKEYQSCAEVIADYPDGIFGRRDGDKDGIPCENVCNNKQQVEALLKKLKKKK